MEEPFHYVFDLCKRNNTPGYKLLMGCLGEQNIGLTLDNFRTLIEDKPVSATKYVTYRLKLNRGLLDHRIYKGEQYIPDYKRQAFTRLRLMSHNLKVELGRWSRIPRNARLYVCIGDQVQDEEHVLLHCPLTRHIRRKYPNLNHTDVVDLLNNGGPEYLCNYF